MAINYINELCTSYSMFLIRNKRFRNYLEWLCIINHVIFGHHSDLRNVGKLHFSSRHYLHIIMCRFCLVSPLFRISSGPFYFLFISLRVLFYLILKSGPISSCLCIFVCFFVFLFQQTCLWCVCVRLCTEACLSVCLCGFLYNAYLKSLLFVCFMP